MKFEKCIYACICLISLVVLNSCATQKPKLINETALKMDSKEFINQYKLSLNGSIMSGLYFQQGNKETKYAPNCINDLIEQSNTQTQNKYRKAKTDDFMANVFGGVGGFLISMGLIPRSSAAALE